MTAKRLILTPWYYDASTKTIRNCKGIGVILAPTDLQGNVAGAELADTEFIVKAVNGHENLVEAVKELLKFGIPTLDDGVKHKRIAAVDKLRDALANAEGAGGAS